LWFARVLYDEREQKAMVSEFIRAALAILDTVPGYVAREGISMAQDDYVPILVGNFHLSAIPMLCFLKHPAFREESELRAVQTGWTIVDQPAGVALRPSGGGIIPYLTLAAASGAGFRFKSVTIGPTQFASAQQRAVGMLLEKHGHEGTPVAVSQTPLRS
jgi:hypothetical protein